MLTLDGTWATPLLLAVIDDHSRLICHLQWYLDETAETLIHGLTQAFQKRGLPRALMTDNGSAMLAEETPPGCTRLAILREPTLPYSPYHYVAPKNMWPWPPQPVGRRREPVGGHITFGYSPRRNSIRSG